MWLPDFSAQAPARRSTAKQGLRRALAACGLLLAVGCLPACTVRPLYADAGMTSSTGATPAYTSVAIAPVTTREAQEVRNHLTFLLTGGARRPANPLYTLTLNVTAVSQSSASIQVVRDAEPTASQLTMTADYVLTETETKKQVAAGKREILSSYDVPRQEFAVLRARRDAENRAARELAEILHLVVVQELQDIQATPVSPK